MLRRNRAEESRCDRQHVAEHHSSDLSLRQHRFTAKLFLSHLLFRCARPRSRLPLKIKHLVSWEVLDDVNWQLRRHLAQESAFVSTFPIVPLLGNLLRLALWLMLTTGTVQGPVCEIRLGSVSPLEGLVLVNVLKTNPCRQALRQYKNKLILHFGVNASKVRPITLGLAEDLGIIPILPAQKMLEAMLAQQRPTRVAGPWVVHLCHL
mmetsp:Transcript_5946/g.14142  ORF Transcript_5946/g.14142 Transcript_5946/m.14142 type:complete len:207 (+) Transcript_5946:763-1383(+)